MGLTQHVEGVEGAGSLRQHGAVRLADQPLLVVAGHQRQGQGAAHRHPTERRRPGGLLLAREPGGTRPVREGVRGLRLGSDVGQCVRGSPESPQAPGDVGLGVTASRQALQAQGLPRPRPLLLGHDLHAHGRDWRDHGSDIEDTWKNI